MAGIDKQHEFYTCLRRLAFLAGCYRPEDLGEQVNQGLDLIIEYAATVETQKLIEKAESYFEGAEDYMRMQRIKDLIRCLAREL